jgi:XTP/dITP diphosphohydrolase
MGQLLLASNNRGKIVEIQALLAEVKITLLTPDELGLDLYVAEVGTTYGENAALKARAFCEASGMVTLADDSGLEVACLGGAPGLYSARFSPQPDATDADRRRFLLAKLAQFPPPWMARFHCTVALAQPDGTVYFAEGECQGRIITEERGHNGFGYDPIFWIPEMERTMAELTLVEKNRLSHRARAVLAVIPDLLRLFA